MQLPLPDPTPQNIRIARDFVRQSMTEAAQRVHKPRQSWSRWEAGEHHMPLADWELYLIKIGLREPRAWQRALLRHARRVEAP